MTFLCIASIFFLASSIVAMDRDLTELPIINTYEPILNGAYPTDLINVILHNLPIESQLAFTATCKRYHNFVLKTKKLSPIKLKRTEPTITDLTFCLGSIFAITVCFASYYSYVNKPIAFTCLLCALCYCFPKGRKACSAEEKVATNSYHFAKAYQSIANRILKKSLIVQELHIDYHEKNQAEPLLAAANGNVSSIFLTIYATPYHEQLPKKPLNGNSLLNNNLALKELSLKVSGGYSGGQSIIDHQSFIKPIESAQYLCKITLNLIPLNPKLLDTILSLKKLHTLSLYDCSTEDDPYDFAILAHNNTLHSLVLHDFRQQNNTRINDTATNHFLEFMQGNKELSLLHIKTHELSNAAIMQLKASHHKPEFFSI